MLDRLTTWARSLKREIIALHIAARDPRTPRSARFMAAAVVAYAISPIDLVPDFIPVLGQIDDLVIVPIGLWLALRMIPPDVMREARGAASAQQRVAGGRVAAALIIGVWIACAAAAAWLILT
jgi:uncharacterized membrane protein YkvA (DUF1232 family)